MTDMVESLISQIEESFADIMRETGKKPKAILLGFEYWKRFAFAMPFKADEFKGREIPEEPTDRPNLPPGAVWRGYIYGYPCWSIPERTESLYLERDHEHLLEMVRSQIVDYHDAHEDESDKV